MADSGNKDPFGMNWKHFEELFKGVSAFHSGKSTDLGWVDKFVTQMLKQAIPGSMAQTVKPAAKTLETEVFETHRSVIVRIMLPSGINPRQLQLYVSSQKLRIEGPEQLVQNVKLPVPVQPHLNKAEFRDGILQVQLRKQIKNERFEEIPIRYS
ncbi:Hsp20/alpha crystallin family protein [Paenibacillus koleovorans]|uniref:Hsp20/alpha crystallin family protein n=1 Tax=Paenibacillus koleovorans TaxID=121608 RepID=UPI000FDBA057|nr:Hsp20/alpha crystallin family protein [Paenibacillus koleovorans]